MSYDSSLVVWLLLLMLFMWRLDYTLMVYFGWLIGLCNILVIEFTILLVLMDCFKIPFDMAESESELIAGIMMEFAALLFS
jgi:NADH:ubiquinone oxidoreductase subunit H